MKSAFSLIRELSAVKLEPMVTALVLALGATTVLAAVVAFGSQTNVLAYEDLSVPIPSQHRVLGAVSYETTTVFQSKNLTLAVTPIEFKADTGQWNYRVSWTRPARYSGSIYLDNKLLADSVAQTGDVKTGFVLDPATKYRLVFRSLAGGHGVRVANRTFTTLASPVASDDVEDANPSP